jgi:hypothetical protein
MAYVDSISFIFSVALKDRERNEERVSGKGVMRRIG